MARNNIVVCMPTRRIGYDGHASVKPAMSNMCPAPHAPGIERALPYLGHPSINPKIALQEHAIARSSGVDHYDHYDIRCGRDCLRMLEVRRCKGSIWVRVAWCIMDSISESC